MSSLSISATDKDGKTTTFARSIITREEIANAKTFLDTIKTDEGHDPTRNSAGGSITGATSSSEPKADASSKETAWTGKEGEAEPKDKSKEKNTP